MKGPKEAAKSGGLMQTEAHLDFEQRLVRACGQEVVLLPKVGCAEVVVVERVHRNPQIEV